MLPLDHESEDFDISELGLSCWMEAWWETQERSSGTLSTGSVDRSPKRMAPGRRRLAETVFLHEFIRGNSRPVKTEYVRIKVIRGHKRWLRKLDLEVMDRQIQKCLGTSQGFWLKQLLDTYQLNPPLLRRLAKATTSLRGPNPAKPTYKSFNKDFCQNYFNSELVRKSYFCYVEYLFSPLLPAKLKEYFGMSCCSAVCHTSECEERWMMLKNYLQFTLIIRLGLTPYSEADFVQGQH